MILRRFMKHVSDQNWFAVGLDVIVVITGIFLGMQVAEWNENTKGQELEQEYISLLREELATTQVAVSKAAARHALRARQTLELLAWFEGTQQTIPDNEAVQNSLCRWYSPTSVLVQTATFDELISTGRLNLLQDRTLRKLLIQSHNRYEAVLYDLQATSGPVQTKMGMLESFILWEPTYTNEVSLEEEKESATRCRIDLERMKAAPEAISLVTQLYRSQVIYQGIREEQVRTIAQVIDHIDSLAQGDDR